MLRRDFLRQSALFGAALSTGCASDDATPTAPGKGQPLIDAHCHVFNASDLPTTRFLRQVVFENYPEQSFRAMGVNMLIRHDSRTAIATEVMWAVYGKRRRS